jgi:squalene-associated FAD-dependent desaturase
MIDNGNHLLLSGNRSAMAYLDELGARDSLVGPPEPAFPFFDLAGGQSWTVRPNLGRLPWWIFAPGRRVPGTRAGDYLKALTLARARPEESVADRLDIGTALFAQFWEPLAVSILNTAAEEGAASLLWPIMTEIFGRGGAASRPLIARVGLSHSFVEPALDLLAKRGAEVGFNRRLRAFTIENGHARSLDFGLERIALAEDDRVVLAVPPRAAVILLPGLSAPLETRAIVNAHFRLPAPQTDSLTDSLGGSPFLGLLGGTAHWLFVRGDVASVTVSAADALAETPSDGIAAALWADVARALGQPPLPVPPVRIIKEKRATFAQTPAQVTLRPGTRTAWRNIFLAGDWIDTGLPATIESAIRAGHAAAAAAGE